MRLKKMADQDAFRWARAEMFFGEGAGTRRKLLDVEISDKMTRIPGYSDAFMKSYEKQNMAEHAIKAAKERARIDHVNYFAKNFKALATGRVQNMSPSFVIIVVGAVVLHQTGYDKVLWNKAKRLYRDVKRDYEPKKRHNNDSKPAGLHEATKDDTTDAES